MSGAFTSALCVPILLSAMVSTPFADTPLALLYVQNPSSETSGWRPLYPGTEIPVDPEQPALVMCPDGGCRELSAPFKVTDSLCRDAPATTCRRATTRSNVVRGLGDPSSPQISKLLSPKELADLLSGWLGRLKPFVLTGKARGPEEVWGEDPVLVSPRCFASGSFCRRLAEPDELIFLRVEDARRYVFELSGPSRYQSLTLSPQEISECLAHPAFDDTPLCRVPWPKTWTLPSNGRATRLRMTVDTASGTTSSENASNLALQTVRPSAPPSAQTIEASPEPGLSKHQHLLRLHHAGLRQELLEALLDEPNLTAPQELLLAQTLFELDLVRPAKFYFERVAGIGNGKSNGMTTDEMRATAQLGAALCAVELDELKLARDYEEGFRHRYLSVPSISRNRTIQELIQYLRSHLDG